MTKRIFSLILALAMLCAFVPCVATAAESGSCGSNVTWVLDDNGTLTISGTGNMTNYGSGSTVPWRDSKYGITSIVIEDGVTSVGNYAFYECSGATSVTIGNSVLSIGSYAFCGCKGLKTAALGNNITLIDKYAFNSCNGLKDIVIPSKVTVIDAYAFNNCTQLETVTLPYSLTTVGSQAFASCSNLTTVYYEGNTADWQYITIDTGNSYLANATIYYGSAAPVTTVTTPATSTSNNTVIVILNGVTLVFDYPPTIIDGRTLVPLRKIFESIGATVTWDDATKTVISTYNGVTITLTIGSNILYKNGYPIELDVPAQLLSDYTMVPVRAIAESFGAEVTWDANTRTVGITTY